MSKAGIDLRHDALPAAEVRAALALQPHPEGGHYREMWRDKTADGSRGAASAILFLLAEGERSHWHRVDAPEVWLWHAGAPLRLRIANPGASIADWMLGSRFGAAQGPQAVVPAGAWQAACSLGAWTLVSCIVAPAFEFAGFELAAPGWIPDAAS